MRSPYLRRKPPNTTSGTLCSLEPCLASCLKMISRMPMSHLRERTAAWGRWATMSARRWFLMDAPSLATIPCRAALLTCQDSNNTTHFKVSKSSTCYCTLLVLSKHGGAVCLKHVWCQTVGTCQLARVLGMQCSRCGKCTLAVADNIAFYLAGLCFEVQPSSSSRCLTSAYHGPSHISVLAMLPFGLLSGGSISKPVTGHRRRGGGGRDNINLICCHLGSTHHAHEAATTCCRADLAFDVKAVTCVYSTSWLLT